MRMTRDTSSTIRSRSASRSPGRVKVSGPAAAKPPRVWLQAGTATIYAHRCDAPNDEATGIIDPAEPGAPSTWRFSIERMLQNVVSTYYEMQLGIGDLKNKGDAITAGLQLGDRVMLIEPPGAALNPRGPGTAVAPRGNVLQPR